ncbi:MAG: phosphoadenosine phosphosulfate reductase family protein [Prevotella sp.]|nr:phosphoadenosine phosphosulfate reductase family protein [Candidatus Prevotella equi]
MDLKTLQERQNWTLDQKIYHSLEVIDNFIARMNGKVYVAWSMGKDSCVLVDLVRRVKPDVTCVFVNTGCEYPDLVYFAREQQKKIELGGGKLLIIRPLLTPKQVWAKYGFPLVSKEVGENVHTIRINPNCIKSKKALGLINPDSRFKLAKRWRYLIDEPYHTSNMCCDKLKKEPSHRIAKQYGLAPILGTLASESQLREKTYIRRGGCNVFGDTIEKSSSLPLSIWTDKDIWDYIKKYKVEIPKIYYGCVERTGCVGCAMGAYHNDDVRFDLLYHYYPKYYKAIMNYTNNGVTYREAVRKMLAVTGKVLPDEQFIQQTNLFEQ